MKSSATSLVTFSGRITVSQCVHSGRWTSASVSHFCEVISSSVADTPSAGERFQHLPGEIGIGRGDVTVERRLASGARLRLLRVRREDCRGRQQGDENSVDGYVAWSRDYSRRPESPVALEHGVQSRWSEVACPP